MINPNSLPLKPVRYLLILASCIIAGCSSLRDSHKYQLTDGRYEYRQLGVRYRNAQVYFTEDSARVAVAHDGKTIAIDTDHDQVFIKRTLDVDVITVPFKFRPIASGVPRQLNTDFNGNVFIGYRLDKFRLTHQHTPIGKKTNYFHKAFSVGGFGGIGSSSINSTTTSNAVTDDYSGFVFSRGLAFMVGINNLTVGLGVGWDHLTDRDRHVWVYQNKPWYGLTLGLNLN